MLHFVKTKSLQGFCHLVILRTFYKYVIRSWTVQSNFHIWFINFTFNIQSHIFCDNFRYSECIRYVSERNLTRLSGLENQMFQAASQAETRSLTGFVIILNWKLWSSFRFVCCVFFIVLPIKTTNLFSTLSGYIKGNILHVSVCVRVFPIDIL